MHRLARTRPAALALGLTCLMAIGRGEQPCGGRDRRGVLPRQAGQAAAVRGARRRRRSLCAHRHQPSGPAYSGQSDVRHHQPARCRRARGRGPVAEYGAARRQHDRLSAAQQSARARAVDEGRRLRSASRRLGRQHHPRQVRDRELAYVGRPHAEGRDAARARAGQHRRRQREHHLAVAAERPAGHQVQAHARLQGQRGGGTRHRARRGPGPGDGMDDIQGRARHPGSRRTRSPFSSRSPWRSIPTAPSRTCRWRSIC